MSLFTITRDNGGVIAWTDDQVAYIIDKYFNENYTLNKLGTQFGCSYATIRNLLHNKGFETRGYKQGYPRNELYFYDINTPEKAYWLGLFYADGCVLKKSNEISLSLKDKEHVEKFKQAIGCYNHKITSSIDYRFSKPCTMYHFCVKDKQLHNDLIKWGCVPEKSLKLSVLPNIPQNYISHFLRGYFDGDGSLHYLKGTNNYRISFSGTLDFLTNIKYTLHKENLSVRHDRNHNVYQLQICGKKQVKRILDYLYKDSTEATRLNRKYELYLKCSEWAHFE